MSNADKAAEIEKRRQMRIYWINMQCKAEELAKEFEVTGDRAHLQILKAKKERDVTAS